MEKGPILIFGMARRGNEEPLSFSSSLSSLLAAVFVLLLTGAFIGAEGDGEDVAVLIVGQCMMVLLPPLQVNAGISSTRSRVRAWSS